MGFLAPLLGAILPGLLGGGAGAANTRPPSLSPQQQQSMNGLLTSLQPTATGTPQIDPIQQALLYGQNAQGLTGANSALTHALVSRGLGRSGLLGQGLMQNQNQSQQNQNQINLGLQQQAIQQKQLSIQDILGLLNVNNTPGQSAGAGFLNGIAPVAAYSIQNMMNQRNNQNMLKQLGGIFGGGSSGGGGSTGNAGDSIEGS